MNNRVLRSKVPSTSEEVKVVEEVGKSRNSSSSVKIGVASSTTSTRLEFVNKVNKKMWKISSGKLRPWLNDEDDKDRAAASMMKQENCLAATYKCMEKRCIFFTSDESLFIDHLILHKKNADNEGCDECAYCDSMFDVPKLLVKHISVQHHFDIFQCSFCFYRSASFVNVQNHIHHYHPLKSTVVIEIVPSQKLEEQEAMKLATNQSYMKNFVYPMKCAGCFVVFFNWEKFQEHIPTCKHCKSNNSKCLKCGEIITSSTLTLHLEKCYSIGLYQCLWCLFGTSAMETLKLHYADKHAVKLPFFCTRSSNKRSGPLLKDSVKVKQLKEQEEDNIVIRKLIKSPGVVNAANVESLEYGSRI